MLPMQPQNVGALQLWFQWWSLVRQLRPAFHRTRTFLWFALALLALSVRTDQLGVTSLVRALGLRAGCYDRLLDFFHSRALDLEGLTRQWVKLVLGVLRPFLHTVQGRLLLVADGLKAPKTGRKMPAVKKLHQESDNNTKPEFIFGHSCQAVAVIARAADWPLDVFIPPDSAEQAMKITEILFGQGDKLQTIRTMSSKDLEALQKETGGCEVP